MKLTIRSNKLKYLSFSLLVVVGVLIAFLFTVRPAPLPQVESTAPQDQDIAVLDNSTIVINFSSPLTNKQQSKINISFSPPVDVRHKWNSPRQLQLFPVKPWPKNTLYVVNVNYDKKFLDIFSFKTNKYSTQELQEQGQQQAKDDVFFEQKMQEFRKQFPWYSGLPIVKDAYTVVYDFEKQAFRLRITKPNPSASEINQLKTDALRQLQNIGVDTKTQLMYVVDNNNTPL